MEAKTKQSFLNTLPAWALSLLTILCTFIFLFATGYPLASYFGDNIGGWISSVSTGILIAIACFFICRSHPKSVWYVPILCNATGILAAIIEPQFWASSMWMADSIGWILSVAGAIIGARIGQRAILK